MLIPPLLTRFALALGIGLLIGMQREWADSKLAGVRTFALIALFGALSAALAADFGNALVACGLLAVAGFAALGNWMKLAAGQASPGLTTELAMLLTFGLGVWVVQKEPVVAVVVAAATTLLLQLKKTLHDALDRLGEDDVRAIMQFVLISLVVLPVLPDHRFGPYDVLGVREIWWMVVLIVGIGLAGYLAYLFLGEKVGTLLGGLLGGLVSSTATTVGYARASRVGPAGVPIGTVVILISSSVVFLRVLVELAAVAPNSFTVLAPPVVAMLGAMAALSTVAWWRLIRSRQHPVDTESQPLDLGNPSELSSALIFGGLYALVLLAVAWARDQLGEGGLYAVAVLSGLTDMDAITLSTARMVEDGHLAPGLGWRLVLVASLSNLVFKLATVAALADRRLTLLLARCFLPALAAGGLILALWPT